MILVRQLSIDSFNAKLFLLSTIVKFGHWPDLPWLAAISTQESEMHNDLTADHGLILHLLQTVSTITFYCIIL